MDKIIHEEIMKLEPSALITLYRINLDQKIPGGVYYFHAGENGFGKTIKFKGKNYYFHPIQVDGFDYVDEALPRPTLTVDNTDSFFGLKTRFFEDFIGYKFTRIRTFVKFLHGDNFPNGVNPYGSGGEQTFPEEVYNINKKNIENQSIVQFELVSPLEKEGNEIPNRKIVFNVCQWRYRHKEGCGFDSRAGKNAIADAHNNKFEDLLPNVTLVSKGEYDPNTTYNKGHVVFINPDNTTDPMQYFVCTTNGTKDVNPPTNKKLWIEDACSKSIAGCRLRWGDLENSNGLPFGGFPGTVQ